MMALAAGRKGWQAAPRGDSLAGGPFHTLSRSIRLAKGSVA